MRKILVPTKDTTVYEAFENNNAGLDEILEIGKVIDRNALVPSDSAYATGSARSLLYFDLPTSATIPDTAEYFVNLRLANASEVRRGQEILVYLVSQSWDEGSGVFYQDIKNSNDGATWNRATATVSWSLAGGDFLTTDTSQSITLTQYPLQDIRINVTNILQPIVSQSLQNDFYGLVLQFPVADETDYTNEGNIKVFSSQTHTIHQPTLEIAWDTQVFSTGSLSAIDSPSAVKIIPNNLRETYTKGDVEKITFTVRDRFPVRSYDSTLRYKNKYYLPVSSSYSIVDVQSNTTVIPFDNYSRINTDATGSYITLDTAPLYKGRFYRLNLKVVSGEYNKTVSTETIFKVE